ncbi:unnamed protein product, partial [Cuscuta epithymum]
MSIVSWNCRGLGNLATVQGVVDIVKELRPSIIFLMETKISYSRAKETLRMQGFYNSEGMDNEGSSGGIIMGWNDDIEVVIKEKHQNYVDCQVRSREGELPWRLTGYYAYSDTRRRREAWDMLRRLAEHNTMPWIVIGDFNDILYESEKKGNVPQPPWRLKGFT